MGGAAQRAKDEAAAIALGAVGQETVGPVGFAMAARTIPAMVEYGRMVARLAPRAWLIKLLQPGRPDHPGGAPGRAAGVAAYGLFVRTKT